MQALDEQSTQTMNKMVEMMEEDYIKIDNSCGSYMPVSVEMVYENNHYKIYSVAHYVEQCGDLICDPEMCFIFLKSLELYYPYYFNKIVLELKNIQ